MTLSVAGVLERAADILERCGRHVENFEAHRGGPCCTAGAINRAVTGDAEFTAGTSAAKWALVDELDLYGDRGLAVWEMDEAIGRWNDDEERTDAEVLSVLRGLAARLRG